MSTQNMLLDPQCSSVNIRASVRRDHVSNYSGNGIKHVITVK